MTKSRGTLSGALLMLVLALGGLWTVGLWTGWAAAILGWVSGHLADAIIGSVDHSTR